VTWFGVLVELFDREGDPWGEFALSVSAFYGLLWVSPSLAMWGIWALWQRWAA
jgi:hypothetical protein